MPTHFTNALCPQVIYVFRVFDEDHKGCLKIGMTQLDGEADITQLPENCDILRNLAEQRINSYAGPMGVRFELLHAECSLFWSAEKGLAAFDDHQVHDILKRSGVERKIFPYTEKAIEWYITDLETVKNAITAAKHGRKSLLASEVTSNRTPIEFRAEQMDAIDRTVAKFRTPGTRMLWNCKMRFGKTLSALQVIKRMGFARTIIVTHRPVVDDGWYDDFKKIFYDTDMRYGSVDYGDPFPELIKSGKPYIYFASIQFLRNTADSTTRELRQSILRHKWDLLIVDEAHEGTQTALGQDVLRRLKGVNTCEINLSGTPFNIVTDFEPDEIVNWTYVDEQREKEKWAKEHPCDYNPYGGLPRMNMAIYDLNTVFDNYESHGEDVHFNFREFFRTWTGEPAKDRRRMPESTQIGTFIHENDVKKFLDLLVDDRTNSEYPFSTQEYRDTFRHTFWVVPGVAEAAALSSLLKEHRVFGCFKVVNVAGVGDEDSEESKKKALKAVQEAIKENPYTITLSCGRLTTGVSIPEWTAVFMLYGATKTKAQGYMQTIFRVQTPGVIEGKRKEECYVFDFAPDRIITAIDETIRAASYATKGEAGTQNATLTDGEREEFNEFLHYCSVIAYEGSKMKRYDVTALLEHLKRVQIERVVRNGFEDSALYNNDFLMSLGDREINELEAIRGIIGKSTTTRPGDFTVNEQGLDEEPQPQSQGQNRRQLTPEEKEALREKNKKKKKRKDAISILRGISIRFPMLIYGADVKDEETGITLDNFTSFVDKDSWEEFMPKGITMQKFYALRKYYDPEVFNACGKRIREKAKAADKYPPLERIKRIEDIMSTFRNPDKETVITPWRVVNMHMSDTVGGYDFFDEEHQFPIDEPRFVDRGKVTYCVFEQENARVLEINSKSGRYPLYMAYTLFRERLKQWESAGLIDSSENASFDEQQAAWDDVIANSVFVICKTPMAAKITKRTLAGYRDVPVRAKCIDNLVDEIENNKETIIRKIKQGRGFWHATAERSMLHFDGIVSNPPYQESQTSENTASNSALAGAIYPSFIDLAKGLADKVPPTYISMITPSRWMTKAGRGISDAWVDEMLNSNSFILMHDYLNSEECFKGVEIKGGVNYFLFKPGMRTKCRYILHQNGIALPPREEYLNATGSGIVIRDAMASEILNAVCKIEGRYFENKSFMDLVGSSTLFCDCSKGILDTNWTGYQVNQDDEHKIKYYVNKSLVACGYAWIKEEDIPKGKESILCHKVYIPKAGGSGTDKVVLGTPFYGEPNSVCSRTYICIGYDAEKHNLTKEECENIISYIKTRFFRFMVSIRKKTQDAFAQVYQFVPVQDFSKSWTDEELYIKYGLTPEQVKYIESKIKSM